MAATIFVPEDMCLVGLLLHEGMSPHPQPALSAREPLLAARACSTGAPWGTTSHNASKEPGKGEKQPWDGALTVREVGGAEGLVSETISWMARRSFRRCRALLMPISLWISVSDRADMMAPLFTLARQAATYQAGIPTQSCQNRAKLVTAQGTGPHFLWQGSRTPCLNSVSKLGTHGGLLFCSDLAQMACRLFVSYGDSTGKEQPRSLSTPSLRIPQSATLQTTRDLGICSAPPAPLTWTHKRLHDRSFATSLLNEGGEKTSPCLGKRSLLPLAPNTHSVGHAEGLGALPGEGVAERELFYNGHVVHGPSTAGLWGAVPLPGEHTADQQRLQSHRCGWTMRGCALPHLQPGDNSGAIPVGKGQSFPPSFFQEFVPGGNRSKRVVYWESGEKGTALEGEESAGSKNQLAAKQ